MFPLDHELLSTWPKFTGHVILPEWCWC